MNMRKLSLKELENMDGDFGLSQPQILTSLFSFLHILPMNIGEKVMPLKALKLL